MIAFVVAAAIASSIDAKAQAILDAAKVASGGAAVDRLGPYEIDERVVSSGHAGTAVRLCDPKTGAFSSRVNLGLASSGDGYDGAHAWYEDATHDTWEVGDEADIAEVRQAAYLCERGYWHTDRVPARIEFVTTEKPTDAVPQEVPQKYRRQLQALIDKAQARYRDLDVLRVSIAGTEPFLLLFDKKTHLLSSTETGLFRSHFTTWNYSDQRLFNGVSIPRRRTREDAYGGVDFEGDITAIRSEPGIAVRVAFVPSSPADASITGGLTKSSVPIAVSGGQIFVWASINGKGPFHFLIDTAIGGLISPKTADRLALGSGDRWEHVDPLSSINGYVRARTVQIGHADIEGQIFGVSRLLDIPGTPSQMHADGVLGFEFFRRFVTRIDYRHRVITLFAPNVFEPVKTAFAVPFIFDFHAPEIFARVDDASGQFVVNTGLPNVMVTSVRWSSHEGLGKFDQLIQGSDSFGFDLRLGGIWGTLERVRSVDVGPAHVLLPTVIVDSGGLGSQTDSMIAGDIGNGLLQLFDVTFDYQKQVLYLRPAADLSKPLPVDRSGLVLSAATGGLFVESVIHHSPAFDAGVFGGDQILAVNGRAADRWTMESLRTLFDQAVGTKVHMVVKTFKKTARSVVITLSDYSLR